MIPDPPERTDPETLFDIIEDQFTNFDSAPDEFGQYATMNSMELNLRGGAYPDPREFRGEKDVNGRTIQTLDGWTDERLSLAVETFGNKKDKKNTVVDVESQNRSRTWITSVRQLTSHLTQLLEASQDFDWELYTTSDDYNDAIQKADTDLLDKRDTDKVDEYSIVDFDC